MQAAALGPSHHHGCPFKPPGRPSPGRHQRSEEAGEGPADTGATMGVFRCPLPRTARRRKWAHSNRCLSPGLSWWGHRVEGVCGVSIPGL